jgi:hypothetical protein
VKHGVPCDFEQPPPAVKEEQQAAKATRKRRSSNNSRQSTSPRPRTPSSTATTASSPTSPTSPPGEMILVGNEGPRNALTTANLSITTPAAARLLEMRLMHHYTTETCKTFTFTAPVTEDLWKTTVPQMALSGSQHLLDAVLAVSALHLRCLHPEDKELMRASHAYMAASLENYKDSLAAGITASNAEALFLTSTLIVNQSTATRIFGEDAQDEYEIPLSWFHAFQGVKTVIANSWQFLRLSPIATQVINSQAVLMLDLNAGENSFFGHLLEGLDDEVAVLPAQHLVDSTKQAYQHAVAVLNWAHKIPHKGAPLAFPATVSRRYVELLERKEPRALAILACFFALLRSLDGVWWLHGLASREVLATVSLFTSGSLGPSTYARWAPHLDWAVRIATWDDAVGGAIPADVWGADWLAEEVKFASGEGAYESYVKHIELLSRVAELAATPPPSPHPAATPPRSDIDPFSIEELVVASPD